MNIQSIKEDLEPNQIIIAYTTDGRPLTTKQYNENLLTAENQIKAGNFLSQDELEKKSAKWKTEK